MSRQTLLLIVAFAVGGAVGAGVVVWADNRTEAATAAGPNPPPPADPALADDSVSETILAALQQARSDLEYHSVQATPVAGLYQVSIKGGPSLFVAADGQHVIEGELYGVEPGRFVNISEQARADKRQEMLAAIPEEEMIVFAPEGETRAEVTVFTDVDCGYCQKLHQEVPKLNAMGVSVRYLAFPRAGLKSESYRKIATAWCAEDPQTTLTKLKNREPVALSVCDDNPVAEQLHLGMEMGVTGTPALLLKDGSLLPGYLPAEHLARRLGLR